MDKCGWKKKEFRGCKDLARYAFYDNDNNIYLSRVKLFYCPFCGADIRKPEEPLIVKDGGTYAAYFKGQNFLWTKEDTFKNVVTLFYAHAPETIIDGWKLFSLIEKEGLTDEIAKLRPMVMLKDSPSIPVKLWGIEKSMGIFSSKNNWLIDGYRLATPKELQEETLANKQ